MAGGAPQPYYQNGKNGTTNNIHFVTSIAAFLSLFASVGLALWTNAKGDVNTVKAELREDMRRTEDRLLTELHALRSIVENKLLYVNEHLEFVRRTDTSLANLRDDISRVRQDQVPRLEHQQHWAEFTSRVDALRDSLNTERTERAAAVLDMRKEFGSTYTAGDQMKNLQDQIKQLAARIDVFTNRSGGLSSQQTPSLPLTVPITPGSVPGGR